MSPIDVTALLSPARTRINVPARSRKRALELAAELLASDGSGVATGPLFEQLLTRERLGSTGLGEGIAIPHCRIDCPHPRAALLRLEVPVDFDAPDDTPVDLLFVLMVPPDETSAHLTTLAALARLFQSAENRAALRAGQSDADLYGTFVDLVRTGTT